VLDGRAWPGAHTVYVMMALVSPSDARALRHRRVPWSRGAWGELLYLASGIPAQFAAVALVFLPWWAAAGPTWGGGGFLARQWGGKWPVPLLFLAVVFLAVPVLTWLHRQRLRATASVDIPPQPRIPKRLTWEGVGVTARTRATWRQLAYHLLVGPALAAAAIFAFFVWLTGVLFTLVYVYSSQLQSSSFLFRGAHPMGGNPRPLGVQLDVYVTLGGIVLLFAAPWVTAGVRVLDVSAARSLLGPSRAEELEHRVEHLTQTRAGVVDAADAERRRLERDLHDGTQQRLVSLAMNLGMARAQATTTQEARQAIADAHEEAKAALTELRDLIRGLHPAVLEDRGLDAALSGLVARSPVPARLTVDLDPSRRPPPVVEAVAYFVVSEGLANVAKHAQASQAEVFVQRAGDRLHVIISDDGVGGADPSRGTGLAGLARRASSVDGTFEIDSPPGGPTLLTVDLPCVR
jgi:signal transduction histidine kinase